MKGHRYYNGGSARLVLRSMALLMVAVVPLKAYADPGSGLQLWQIAGALFLGCVYQFRNFLAGLRKKGK